MDISAIVADMNSNSELKQYNSCDVCTLFHEIQSPYEKFKLGTNIENVSDKADRSMDSFPKYKTYLKDISYLKTVKKLRFKNSTGLLIPQGTSKLNISNFEDLYKQIKSSIQSKDFYVRVLENQAIPL